MANSASVMLVVLVGVALASQLPQTSADRASESYASCLRQVAAYMARKSVPEPVKLLVNKSREFYPQISVLLRSTQRDYNAEYFNALMKLGPQEGCEEILEHVNQLEKEIPCKREEQISSFDLASHPNEAARNMVEAEFVCMMS